MKKTTLFLVVILVFSITATTEAAVVVFDNEADYNAATGSQIFLIDFDGNPPGGTLALGSSFSAAVTFGSPEASDPTQVWWNSDAICDAGSLIAPNGVGPVDGVFTDPVYAFALLFSSSGAAEEVSLYDESDVLIATVTAPNPSGFFGVLSDTPIKSFEIDNGEFWKEPEEEFWPDRFFIDDFRANEPPIEVDKVIDDSVDLGDGDGYLEVGEFWGFVLAITVTNNSDLDITDLVVKDRLGGDLGFADSDPAPSDIDTKGKTNKVFLEWELGTLPAGDSTTIYLIVYTDINTGTGNGKKSGHQEYTSTGEHELNSGANAKGMLDDELQVSNSSDSVTVEVLEPGDYD
jgi:hypothetical protein